MYGWSIGAIQPCRTLSTTQFLAAAFSSSPPCRFTSPARPWHFPAFICTTSWEGPLRHQWVARRHVRWLKAAQSKYEPARRPEYGRKASSTLASTDAPQSKCSTADISCTPSPSCQSNDLEGADLEVRPEFRPRIRERYGQGSAALQAREKDGDKKGLPQFTKSWSHLFRKLSFPEHGDLLKARESLAADRDVAVKFAEEGEAAKIWQKWCRLSPQRRAAQLPSILAGSLADSADLSLLILSTFEDLPRDWLTRAECLVYLKRVYWDDIVTSSEREEKFLHQINRLCRPETWPLHSMPPVFLDLLLRHCPPDEFNQMACTFLERYQSPSSSALLLLVDHFTQRRDHEQALHYFARIPLEERQASGPEILQRCTNLLTLDFVERSESSPNFKILPNLLKLGVRPDGLLHNLVIQNAVASGLPNVAWDLFLYMNAEGLSVNARTHLFLLKDSFLRPDVERLNVIMSAIHQRDDLARDPYLVAYTMNIVRVVCYFEHKCRPEESLSHILAVYDRAYDRAPLVKLGIARPLEADHGPRLPEPSPAGLAFTLWSYILVQHQERYVSSLWHWVLKMIENKDRTIVEAAKHPVLYDGLILFYSRRPSTLVKGLGVLHTMLELNLCMPTERTWSLIICSFLKYGQEDAAEELRRMMILKGMRMTGPGWDPILQRYPDSDFAARIKAVLDARQMPEELADEMGQPHIAEVDEETPKTGPGSGGTPNTEKPVNWEDLIDFRALPHHRHHSSTAILRRN